MKKVALLLFILIVSFSQGIFARGLEDDYALSPAEAHGYEITVKELLESFKIVEDQLNFKVEKCETMHWLTFKPKIKKDLTKCLINEFIRKKFYLDSYGEIKTWLKLPSGQVIIAHIFWNPVPVETKKDLYSVKNYWKEVFRIFTSYFEQELVIRFDETVHLPAGIDVDEITMIHHKHKEEQWQGSGEILFSNDHEGLIYKIDLKHDAKLKLLKRTFIVNEVLVEGE